MLKWPANQICQKSKGPSRMINSTTNITKKPNLRWQDIQGPKPIMWIIHSHTCVIANKAPGFKSCNLTKYICSWKLWKIQSAKFLQTKNNRFHAEHFVHAEFAAESKRAHLWMYWSVGGSVQCQLLNRKHGKCTEQLIRRFFWHSLLSSWPNNRALTTMRIPKNKSAALVMPKIVLPKWVCQGSVVFFCMKVFCMTQNALFFARYHMQLSTVPKFLSKAHDLRPGSSNWIKLSCVWNKTITAQYHSFAFMTCPRLVRHRFSKSPSNRS